VVVKDALTEVTPLLFLALRFSVATLALLVMFRRKWSHPRKVRAAVRGGVVCGIFLFAGYAFQTFGLRLTTAPKSAFLTGLSTVTVPLLAALVYRARLRAAELAGVGLAMTGMGLMTLEGAALSSINPGDILTLACAVAFAAHIVASGRSG
jgi:drug/metabolite transporter (DMT)-like permease